MADLVMRLRFAAGWMPTRYLELLADDLRGAGLDVCTKAERDVLDACAALATTTVQQALQPRENNPQGKWHGPAAAELARRRGTK